MSIRIRAKQTYLLVDCFVREVGMRISEIFELDEIPGWRANPPLQLSVRSVVEVEHQIRIPLKVVRHVDCTFAVKLIMLLGIKIIEAVVNLRHLQVVI